MFTSKLPRFATSAKRPSGPNDGSTSFLSSNIPVSVRKANLFTPQPKRSIYGAASSSKPYMTTEKKFQRVSKPVPDRDEQMKMFASLVDYLKAKAPGFPVPDPKKFFSSVSTTETTRIFQVLLSHFFPQLKINKLEVDVPEALAVLDYPFIRSVTKSSLVSVTTRQAVGNLLVIFNWLTVRAKRDESLGTSCRDVDIFMSLLSGEEEVKESDNNGRSEKQSQLEMIEAEADELYQLDCQLENYEVEILKHDQDIQQCNMYYEQMREYEEDKQNKLIQVDMKLSECDREPEMIFKELTMLETDPLVEAGMQLQPEFTARREERVRSLYQEIENETNRHATMSQQSDAQYEQKAREFENSIELFNMERTRNEQEISSTSEKRKQKAEECEQRKSLLLNLLRQELETNKSEAISYVNVVKRESDSWKQAANRSAENNKVVSYGLKLLCATK